MDQSVFAAALLDPGLPVPPGVTSARGKADVSRFSVYRNNVAVGLTKALQQRFPVVVRLVGEEFFRGLARSFVVVSPPATPLIFSYGDGFADFIAGFAPAAGLPYLADVARIEAAWTRAYHAADVPALTVETLAGVPPETIAGLTLGVHPAATLIGSDYAVGTIWQAHQQEAVAPLAVNGKEWILVTRAQLDVHVHIVPEADVRFAAAIFAGTSVGEAAAQALVENPKFEFGSAIVGLVSLGAFSAMGSPAAQQGGC